MIIYDEKNKIGIMWEVKSKSYDNFYFGSIHFVINDTIVPSYFIYSYTINVVFSNLKSSVEEAYNLNLENKVDLPCMNISRDLICGNKMHGLYSIDLADMEQGIAKEKESGFLMWIGFYKDKEIIFYTSNFGRSIYNVPLTKGTFLKMIKQLPNSKTEAISA